MPKTKQILDVVKGFFIDNDFEFCNYDDEKLMNQNLINDIALDSLDILELIITIEKEFNIDISDTLINNIKSVSDLVCNTKLVLNEKNS